MAGFLSVARVTPVGGYCSRAAYTAGRAPVRSRAGALGAGGGESGTSTARWGSRRSSHRGSHQLARREGDLPVPADLVGVARSAREVVLENGGGARRSFYRGANLQPGRQDAPGCGRWAQALSPVIPVSGTNADRRSSRTETRARSSSIRVRPVSALRC